MARIQVWDHRQWRCMESQMQHTGKAEELLSLWAHHHRFQPGQTCIRCKTMLEPTLVRWIASQQSSTDQMMGDGARNLVCGLAQSSGMY